MLDALGTPLRTPATDGESLTATAIAPDARSVLIGAADGALSVWDVDEDTLRALPSAYEDHVTGIAWHRDGALFVTGSYDGTVRVHRAADASEQARIDLGSVKVWDVAMDPRGPWVAVALADGRVLLWDFATGEQRELAGHTSIVIRVAFHPDGGLLASGSDDSTLRVWDVESGTCTGTLRGHEGAVRALAIDPTGRRCATGSEDETLRVWDLVTLRTLATFEDAAFVSTVAFSSDGERLFSGGTDHVVRVWESRLQTASAAWSAAQRREALEVRLGALFMNHLDVARVEELVARDPALDSEERAIALQLVRAPSHIPEDWLAEAAWTVVCDPDRGADEYDRAREAARNAVESRLNVTHLGYYRATLALALYRTGRYDGALEMADDATRRLRSPYRNDRFPAVEAMRAIDEVVAALSLAALGERERALERYDAIPALEVEDRTMERLLAEARALLGR